MPRTLRSRCSCRGTYAPIPFLEHDRNSNSNAGIIRVVQVISAINIIDVNVVGVVPTFRPRLNKSEPITAVLEAGISINHLRTADMESMLAPKVGTEVGVRYAPIASRAESQCWLSALPGFILR